eukprot:CAMPEP_0202811960 /NCGR_PEP_ID=MMETSP1389-20130828/3687_1 /ASSEMBLY_ACC=CAM_ASM_000865 /TAXON_ID=302021 /ORGANISM="Rhodomonas sp., Strain CCMP768" /LENGTH=145 /DNA_ID=CAMNT_0049483215 /DNA_START=157 /DNA_END=594 /DNA_ORIENTATION=+
MATCLKEPKFLNFFFKRLVRNTLEEGSKHLPAYQYVSPCGKELNFVRAEDTGIVFHQLAGNRLVYAADLSVPYQPEKLCISEDGRLYHPAPEIGLGLIASGLVASAFQEHIEVDSNGSFLFHMGDQTLKLPVRQSLTESVEAPVH